MCEGGGGVDEYVSTAKLGLELVQKTRPLSPTLLLRARTKRQTTFRHGQCSLSHGSGRRRSGAGRRPFFRDRTKPFQTVFFSLVFLKKVQDGHWWHFVFDSFFCCSVLHMSPREIVAADASVERVFIKKVKHKLSATCSCSLI